MKDLYKTIEKENGIIKIFERGEIETHYAVPEWGKEEELAFRYNGEEYFLSEFVNIHNEVYNPNPSEWTLEFDGHLSETVFSGLFVKLVDNGEAVKVYIYSC